MFDLSLNFYLLVAVYLSILYEIVVLPVPSVASTYQLFFKEKVDKTVLQYEREGLLMRVREYPFASKIILLLIPTVVSVFIYLFPLSLFFLPKHWVELISINALQSSYLALLAIVLMIAGRTLAIQSVLNIRKQNTQKSDDFDLKTGGLFGLSRNPILLGMYITYWGIFLLLPNWISLIGFIIYVANMHFRILLEEDFLHSMFGNKFSHYFENTRRYL